jgi:hypothetical protein
MNKFVRASLALFGSLTISLSCFAGTILDTGAVNTQYTGGWSLASFQWLASEFTIPDARVVTDINGWLGGGPSTLHVSVWSTNGFVPTTLLYSQGIASVQRDNTWVGASGLDWALEAGTYFVAFEVRPGDTYYGGMASNAVFPSGNTSAFTKGNIWYRTADLGLGLQILDDRRPVPEPGSLALLGLGAFVLCAGRRQRLSKAAQQRFGA